MVEHNINSRTKVDLCEFEVILDYIQKKEKEEVVKEEKGERKEGRGGGGDEKG